MRGLMKEFLAFIWYKYVGAFFRCFPIKRGRILFENFFGQGYGDNPKYIAQELLNQKIENIELIWLVRKDKQKSIPKEIRQVRRGSLKELYYLSTSQVWIDNSRKHNGVIKKKGQFYIQTWHGGIALKKIENDVITQLDKAYVVAAKSDSKMIDVLLSGNLFFTNIFRECFWYNGRILNCGLPRTDIFFEKHNIYVEKVSKFYHIDKKQKIALYAPTFRDGIPDYKYGIDFMDLLEELEGKWNNEWIALVRLHPNAKSGKNGIMYSDRIIDATTYPDINHLIIACDLLVTDYSSCMFDALYAKKDVILYVPDKKEYLEKRGTYFEIDKLPFALTTNMQELSKAIREYDHNELMQKGNGFLNEIGSVEKGNASKEVVKLIREKIDSQENCDKK